MTIVVEPAFLDVAIRGGRAEHIFHVRETDPAESFLSHTDAYAALMAEAPATDGSLLRSNRPDLSRVNNTRFLGRIEYAQASSMVASTGDFEINFDIGGASQLITQSLQTVNSYAPIGQSPPDFRQAIGVTRDGVQGVQIVVPEVTYQRRYFIDEATINDAWIKTAADLVGTVSTVALFSFAIGEMLLVGVSGSYRFEQEDWDITMRWSRRKNRSGFDIGNITNIDQQGWDYQWTFYQDEEDDDAHLVVRRPIAVYVERVYDRADHTAIIPS